LQINGYPSALLQNYGAHAFLINNNQIKTYEIQTTAHYQHARSNPYRANISFGAFTALPAKIVNSNNMGGDTKLTPSYYFQYADY
jgi:hypothetical protein